jgi:catechol 2,3-dioxygenase-like lactoylglutathione lyase family enzyme
MKDMKRVAEIAMFTGDVEGTATFYERLLGVAPVARGAEIAIFDLGGIKLLIHEASTQVTGGPPNEDHVAFVVTDLDAACRQLVEQGLAVELGPRDYDWGRSAYLRDPDGRLLELHEAK